MSDVLMKDQAYDLDRMAIKIQGVSGRILMQEAGRKIADFINENISSVHSIAIVAGKGNNGGDGFAAALHLNNYNYNINVFSIYSIDELSKDALYFYKKCINSNIPIITNSNPPSEYEPVDLAVDAILGIGFNGVLKKDIRQWALWINKFPSILACDIATGVDSNSGQVDVNAIKANYTIAMGYPKIGSLIEPGKSFSGLIASVDIGFPKKIKELNGTKWKIVTDKYIKKTLKPLKRDTHKYKQGKVLILAGSDGMTGAAYLSTMGALRSGCGITKTFAPASLKNIYEKKITEGMTIACNDRDLGYFTTRNYSQITEHIDWADAVLIGPGLGTNSETVKLLKMLYRSINKPMVIDADGFSAFYKDGTLIKRLKNKCVLTPHAGELSNLINVPSEVIKKDLIQSIEKITQSGVGVLVAKGAPSLISNGKYGFINSTGNPGLATAGSGDILSGIITSFIAQGYKLIEATVISCYIHGYTGDIKSKEISERGIIASDLLVEIGKKLSEYEL